VTKIRLDSWKSIAEYLKRSPRTVQRWHAEYGLPVHHFGGGKGHVFSYPDELDSWLSGFSEDPGAEAGSPDQSSGTRKRNSQQLTAQAEEMWELRSEDNLSAIAALYRRAMDQDPTNASAFVGLANVLILASMTGSLQSSSAHLRATEALHRAVRLGAESAEARCAAAWLLMVHERDWKAARAAFDMAIRRQPRSSFALAGRGLLYVAEGNLVDASRCLREAWKENALASASNAFLHWTQYLSGDYGQALEAIAQSRASGESNSLTAAVEALALIQMGPVAAAIQRIEAIAAANPKNLALRGAFGYACAIADQMDRAQDIVRSLKRFQGEPSYALALVLMGLEERSEAVSCLEQSFTEGSLWSLGFRFDPVFRPMKDDHRFASLLRKLDPSGRAAEGNARS
jgi:tetratricopeptide (TPR) repeat protein